jgi:hypothetical protein
MNASAHRHQDYIRWALAGFRLLCWIWIFLSAIKVPT